ncbi:MAG: enoyl-CoA hydratase/isomerase family protein [Erythrobacter sp.]
MDYFRKETRSGATLVTLDNPPYNTVNAELMEAGTALIEGLAGPVVLTGAGANFTRGMDTKLAATLDAEGRLRTIAAINRFCAALHRMPGPLVCAVNGHTIGAGGIVTLTADWVVAAEGDYKIGLPEARAGLAFPPVPQAILDHWLDPVWRRRMALSSILLAPQEAVASGMVDEVVAPETLIDTALTRAEALAEQPAFEDCKRQLRAKANAEIDALLA